MEIRILQCNGCGANLSPVDTSCTYCQSVHVVVAHSHPLHVEEKYAKRIAGYYRDQVNADPTDSESLLALGMFHLNLRHHELAVKHLGEVIAQVPDEADAYYYMALAMLEGKRPKALDLEQIRKVEKNVSVAMQLDDKAKYYCLAAIIKHEFYAANGMKIPPPDAGTLLEGARSAKKEPGEIGILLKNVIIRDETLSAMIRRASME